MQARRLLSITSGIAAIFYTATLVIVPLLNRDLNVMATHPEDYASGAFGVLVNASYAAFAVALATLAAALYPGRRMAALWPALLIVPALLCGALAFSPAAVARSGAWVSLAVAVLAVAPIAISLAMTRRLGARRRWAIALAAGVAVAFLCLAASPTAVSGLVNSVFDVMAGSWVAFVALASRPDRGAIGPRV